MNRKRNVNYIKPEDPEFLKVFKRQAGYDDRNHKFDELENDEKDFVDDEDSEKPQVVVLKKGDLTAEEADIEQQKLQLEEEQTKADLTQRVIFKPKNATGSSDTNKRKHKGDNGKSSKEKKSKPVLSFDDDEEEEDEES